MVSSGKVYPRNRRGGRFFGRRVNCEQVPALPAWILGRVLTDPREMPYLLVWRSRYDNVVQEAVRVASYREPPGQYPLDWSGWVEIKRPDMTRTLIRTLLRTLPRNRAQTRLAICPTCQNPRRTLYAWEVDSWGQYKTSARTSAWKCRACAGLRYTSEGGVLVLRSRGSWFRALEMTYGRSHSPCPKSWLPEAYTSRQEMLEAGFCKA